MKELITKLLTDKASRGENVEQVAIAAATEEFNPWN
jgi:hypothetical protein